MELLGFICLGVVAIIIIGAIAGFFFEVIGDFFEAISEGFGCLAPIVLIIILVVVCAGMSMLLRGC